MKFIGIQGCKKIKSLLGFAETVKQSSNYFRESVDALIFACRQKRHDTNGQSGRSIIEMLGVLAIIGILSIGGLAGYSKAIDRYRTNETINQITYIVQNTREVFKNQRNFSSLSSDNSLFMSDSNFANRKLADKVKLFPDSLVKNNYKNFFGGEISLWSCSLLSADDKKAICLSFRGIPQETCIELATQNWQGGLDRLVLMRVVSNNTSDFPISPAYKDTCTSGYELGCARACAKDMPMSMEYAVAACNREKDNGIAWKFY